MKLRLPNKLQAALIAAIATVGFTLPQAQAAEQQLTLNKPVSGGEAKIEGSNSNFNWTENTGNLKSWCLTFDMTSSSNADFFNLNAGSTASSGYRLATVGNDVILKNNAGNELARLTSVVGGSTISLSFVLDVNDGGTTLNTGTFTLSSGEQEKVVANLTSSASANSGDNTYFYKANNQVRVWTNAGAQKLYHFTLTQLDDNVVDFAVWQGTDGNNTWKADNFAPAFEPGGNVKFSAGHYTTVVVDSTIEAGAVTVDGAAYTFNIQSGASLSARGVSLAGDGASATLAGAGTYVLASGTKTLGSISLGSDWTGYVRLSGVSFSNDNIDSLARNGAAGVEMAGITGGYAANWSGGTVHADIRLTNPNGTNDNIAWKWSDGTTADNDNYPTVTFDGTWDGSGTFRLTEKRQCVTFSGDISGWNGAFDYSGGHGTKLTFTGSATTINAAILNNGTNDANKAWKQFHLIVDNNATFNKAVGAYTLDITANHTATFGGTTNIANGVTLNSGSTLVNTGTMTLGGTIVFGENSIQNNGSGTINFGSNIHFDITNLAFSELEEVTTYTLFSGNAVDLHGFNTNNITVAGGTAGKEWTFHEDGTITFQLSRSVDWNNGAGTGKWNYTDANWSDNRQFQPNMVANFFTNAEAIVSENVVAGGIEVGQADADAPTVTISAEGGSTLTAGALDVVKGTLTTNTALLGLENVNTASGTTWNINADQTLGAGTYAGVISVGAGHTVTLNDAGNASSLLAGITGAGNITLATNATINNSTGTQAAPVETHATGTLTIAAGKTLTISGSNTKYADIDSFSAVVMESGASINSQNYTYTINNLTVNGNTITLSDTGSINNTALHLAGTTTLTGNLKLASGWKYKVEIDKLTGSGNLELTGGRQAHQVYIHQDSTAGTITMGDGMDGSSDGKNSLLALEAGMTLSGDLTLKRGTTEVYGTTTVGGVLDLSVNGNSTATLTVKNGGTVVANGAFWGRSASHLVLEQGGRVDLNNYGVSLVGREGGGSLNTTENNAQYGIGSASITITGADVTVTTAGTGAVTIGNKLTNSKLTTGSHAVTLSHAEDSLIGLTISNGGSFTLNNTSPVDVADIDIEAGGTLVLGAENLISGEYTVDAGTLNLGAGRQSSLTTLTINDGGTVISSRQAQASGFLANNGTVVINGSGVLKFTGNNDALGWGGGHVASVTLNGTDAEHVATLDLSAQSGSETMATNLVLNGYAHITASAGNSAFNTYGGTITATGTENVIDKVELRSNATINVGADATLEVKKAVLSSQTDMKGGLTKTGAGTLTFTESAASTNLTVSEGAVVSKGTATLGALNLQGGSYTVEAGSTTVTGLTTMTNSATLANAGELTLNGLTMGAANTLTNTGALQLNGTVLFGTAGIANNGTGSVAFADDIIFNISQLQEGEGHTYTLFTGDSAVDLTGFTATAADHITGVTVTGRAWTFSNNGQLSYEILSRNLVWNGGAGTWTTDTETTPWHVDGSEEPVSFATGDAARFAASGTPAEVTLGSNITAAGITVDAGATVTMNPEGHTLSADVANIDGVLTSALATHSVTIGESGVWNMAGGTLNVADVSISNEGLIHLMDGAKVTATKDNVSTLGAVSAEGTGTLEVGGTGTYTFAGQESDPFAGRLIYNIGSTGGHDSSIRLSNFEGTLEIRGRVNYSNSQFGNMSKLVFNGDRSSNTTGLWNTGVANIGVDLDIIGDQLVDFYASNTINVNGNINAAGVQGHLGKENNQTMNLNGITNLLSLRVKDGTVNLKDGTIGTVVVNGGKTVNFNGALTVTDSLEANVNTNLTVGAEGVLDIAGISIAGTAQGTTITTSANNSGYSLGNESYTITNAGITAKQDVEIANRLSNSMVYTDDKAVTLSNIDNVVAGATVGLGSFGMTGGTLNNAITNAGTVSLTEVTLGGGFSQVAEDVHFGLNGDVVTDMNANYYLGVEEYVQVVNGGTITGGSTARWADHSYGVQANGRIILEEALADYTTYYVQSGDVFVGEVLGLHELTNTFYVSGGTLNIDGEYNELNITVTDSGTIKGYTAPKDVTIVPEAEVTFEQGIEDTDNGVTFSSSEGGVVVKNTDGPAGGEAFEYTIDQTSAQVTADVLTVNSEEDVTIANQLDVTTIENLSTDGESTLELTHSSAAENVENVRAIRGDIAFVNIAQEASIELKELTIGMGKKVGFNTSENVFDEAHEATVVIAAASAPEAQDGGVLNVLEGATLNANLVMEAGSTLDVSHAQDTYGLIMGSSVTLKEGVLLQDSLHDVPSQNMNAFLFDYFKGEGAPEYYYLYDSVEELYIQQGAEVKRFTELDFVNWRNFDMDASRVFTELDENTYALVYNWDPIHQNVVALRLLPEPTTGTLSLLALCALAARRRRK